MALWLKWRRRQPCSPCHRGRDPREWWLSKISSGVRNRPPYPSLENAAGAQTLDVEDTQSLLQAGNRIPPLRGPVFVRYKSWVRQIGDGLGDEAIVQLLCFVDFM